MTPGFTICWLLAWLFSGAPDLAVSETNEWVVALVVCALIDLFRVIGSRDES